MGIKERIKKGNITKAVALNQIKKWIQEQPYNAKTLCKLARWVENRK